MELRIMNGKDVMYYTQDLEKIIQDWIFSIIVDTEKNINSAISKMNEQRRDLLQFHAYQRQINQLEVLDQLLHQSQESMPLIHITKMKRGKGIKTQVKELLKQAMLEDKRNLLKIKNVNENYEFDLIAILRNKPYNKR